MWRDNPFRMWLLYAQEQGRSFPTVSAAKVNEKFQQLEAVLNAPAHQKIKYDRVSTFGFIVTQAQLTPEQVRVAQDLYMRVWQRGGANYTFVLRNLIDMIALALQADSVPFWQALLDLKKPRDHARQERVNCAIAALALLAYQRQNTDAQVVLRQVLQHPEAVVRAAAVFFLVELYDLSEMEVSDDVLAALRQCAAYGKDYAPRYQARLALWYFEAPLPLANPGGAYVLKVRFRYDRSPLMRVLALRSEQTLFDLHMAVQEAFEWDADHLYSFYMNGDTYDRNYEITVPEEDFMIDDMAFAQMLLAANNNHRGGAEALEEAPAPEDDDEADDAEWSVYTVRLGDLDLLPKQKFVYLFDFGDSHEFEISVEAIEPQADGGEYPRLLEAVGEAPQQYDYPDDEYEDDEDDEY